MRHNFLGYSSRTWENTLNVFHRQLRRPTVIIIIIYLFFLNFNIVTYSLFYNLLIRELRFIKVTDILKNRPQKIQSQWEATQF